MRIGLHVSTKGGLSTALARSAELGLDVVQAFLGSPRSWSASTFYDDATTEQVLLTTSALPEFSWYVHLPYIINIASPDGDLQQRSTSALIDYCTTAERLGASGAVLHVGNHRGAGYDAVHDRIVHSLQEASSVLHSCELLLENAAGQRNAIGSTLRELGQLIAAVDSEQLGLCLDTAHLMGAGIEFRDPESLSALLTVFRQTVGLERLALLHLNDSKRGLGSGRDLHENIGYGTIGIDGFAPLLTCPALADVPAILEVPGLDGTGPDIPNLAVAREIASGGRPPITSITGDQLRLGL